MTKVDFYQLPADSQDERQLFACRLAEKAFRQGLDVYLHTGNQQQAEAMDELLWSFRSHSFLPHGLMTEPQAINIGFGNDPGGHHQLLINLSNTIPDFFSRFERVSEIIVDQEQLKVAGRQNYKFYKDRGYALSFHDMRKE